MPIAVIDWEIFLLLFVFILTFEISLERPMYGILSGMIGIIFGTRISFLLGPTTVSGIMLPGIIFAVSLFITISSIFRKHKMGEPLI